MVTLTYDQAVDLLLQRFPEFKEAEEYEPEDHELPYLVWGGFGRYATVRMRGLTDDDPFVIRVFDFANELMDRGDEELQNLVIVELFENLAQYRETYELGCRKLKQVHLSWLERQRA